MEDAKGSLKQELAPLRQKHRDRLGIMTEILEICNSPQRRTKIMYGAGLSAEQMGTYMQTALDAGLLEIGSGKDGTRKFAFYRTTEKGRDFIRGYEKLSAMLPNPE